MEGAFHQDTRVSAFHSCSPQPPPPSSTAVYNPAAPTPVLKDLADGGVRLGRHYTYKYCSPTRRSFLTGRLPIHMTGAQAPPCSNWLPLEFTILPQKLAQAPGGGYASHVVGKGHWGYQTTDHLPINRGFTSHVGYLAGAEDYVHGKNYGPTHDCSSTPQQCFTDMWHDNHTGADVIGDIEYSTNYYSRRTVDIIEAAPADQPLALFLLYQGVHVPYVLPSFLPSFLSSILFFPASFLAPPSLLHAFIPSFASFIHSRFSSILDIRPTR